MNVLVTVLCLESPILRTVYGIWKLSRAQNAPDFKWNTLGKTIVTVHNETRSPQNANHSADQSVATSDKSCVRISRLLENYINLGSESESGTCVLDYHFWFFPAVGNINTTASRHENYTFKIPLQHVCPPRAVQIISDACGKRRYSLPASGWFFCFVYSSDLQDGGDVSLSHQVTFTRLYGVISQKIRPCHFLTS